MRLKTNIKPLSQIVAIALLAGLSSGCIEEAKLNTDTVVYTPEERPLGVIAGERTEYEMGSQATITLSGRLVGTVTNERVQWRQLSGTAVEGVTDWNVDALTFTSPTVDGIEDFEFEISAVDSDGKVINDADGNPLVASTSITVFDPAKLVTYEVEDSSVATLAGVNLVASGDANYLTGATGQHTADITPGASVTFTLNVPNDSFYSLYVRFGIPASGYGSKNAVVSVNGVDNEVTVAATGSFDKYPVGIVKLTAGDNTIEIGGGWNYYRVDSILLLQAAEPPAPLAVAPNLVNENASKAALDLMAFLTDNYGSKTLSGQNESSSKVNGTFPLTEFDKVVAATGDDAPAIVAFDLIDFSASRVANGAQPAGLVEAMIAEHKAKNVMLSALWHWNAPMHLLDADGDGLGDVSGSDQQAWWSGFYSRATSFDLTAALADTNSAEYQALIADIDTIAVELKKLADADIPVLWRPLHEAQGEWFWWGASGSASFKALWNLMYERLTVTHGLNNLIWVFTYSGDMDASWYPGDDKVDIVGYDGYDGNNANNPFKSQYATLKQRHNGKKMVALTETGTIPNVELMHEQNAWWSFFTTWNSGGELGPDGIDAATIDTNYVYDGVINLADIPGGRVKVQGNYASFEKSTQNWGAQLNWSDTAGLKVSDSWAASGANSLAITNDLTTETTLDNVVYQTYPAEGIDVTGINEIRIFVNTLNAGTNSTAHIFFKAPDGVESWPAAVPVPAGGVELSIDVSQVDLLTGLGVRFEGLDGSASAASYFIDAVTKVDSDGNKTLLYDFEPSAENWGTQIGWSDTTGITASSAWSDAGGRSLALYKDLAAYGSASDIVFQTYPADGIDVATADTITVQVNATGAGSGVNAHIFFKAPDGVESWPDAVAVVEGGTQLSIDVSEIDLINGLGVRFNGVDPASSDAKFFVDTIVATGTDSSTTLYNFDGTGEFGLQVNWANAPGLQLSTDWAADGDTSLAAFTTIADGDEVIFQTYPTGGILLGDDVTTLKISAYVENADANVTVHIFWKGEGTEGGWDTAVPVTANGVELSVDISAVAELDGFGVRFQGLSATQSKFYIDNIKFE